MGHYDQYGNYRPDLVADAQKAELDRLHTELAEAKVRITGLESQLRHMHTFDSQHRTRIAELRQELALYKRMWERAIARAEKAEARVAELEALCKAQHGAVARAERAEAEALKAKAHIAALCDVMVYSDSYGVQGSDFQCCHACSAGGAPNVAFKHDEHCPVGKAEASATEWWDDHKAAEEDRERAEAERDIAITALAGAEIAIARDEDITGAVRIITKARAALAPSPTDGAPLGRPSPE